MLTIQFINENGKQAEGVINKQAFLVEVVTFVAVVDIWTYTEYIEVYRHRGSYRQS